MLPLEFMRAAHLRDFRRLRVRPVTGGLEEP